MYNIYLRHAYPNELYHHGIKGQRWGIRRFQNPDGTLTTAGKKRYGVASMTKTKNAIDSVQNKIQNFEKLGFKDDGEPTKHSIWLEKSVNNKGRKATLVVAVDKDGEDDLGGDFSKTVKRLENNIGRIDDVGKKHIHDSFKSEYGGKVPAYKLSDMQLRIVGPDACELSYTLNSPGIEGGYVQTNFNPITMKPQGRVYHD